MRTIATLAACAALTVSGFAANAGGLSPEIMEAPEVMEPAPPAGSSIDSTFVILGVLAALLIAAAVNANDDDSSTPSEETDLSQ